MRWMGLLCLLLLLYTCNCLTNVDLATVDRCHWHINATENSTFKPNTEDLLFNVCSWSIRPSQPNQMLVISRQNGQSEAANSSFRIFMDGKSVSFKANCTSSNCQIIGMHLHIIYKSNNASIPVNFSLNYNLIDMNECSSPKVPLNGRIVELSGNKLGDSVVYACNSPYVMNTNGLIRRSEALCHISDNLVPEWNESAPSCFVPRCSTNTPYRIEVDELENRWVVNPGYPDNFTVKKSKVCSWEISPSDSREQILLLQLEYARLHGKESALLFYDGKISDSRLLISIKGTDTKEFNLTSVSNRVIIQLKMSSERSVEKDVGSVTSFKIKLSTVPRICPSPLVLDNGDVRGALSAQQQAVYSCDDGYYLNGSDTLFCTEENGIWNSTVPLCLKNKEKISGIDYDINGEYAHAKPKKESRPHPQSTEDKTKWKEAKGEENVGYAQVNSSDYSAPVWDEYPEEDAELIDLSHHENVDFDDDDEDEEEEFPTKLAVGLGVGIPVVVGVLAAVSFAVYRKHYPVRMSIGRKFGTYENPVYESSKRNPGRSGGTLLPNASMTEGAAELQRLTSINS